MVKVDGDSLVLNCIVVGEELVRGGGGEGDIMTQEEGQPTPAQWTRAIPSDEGVAREIRRAGGGGELRFLNCSY